MKTRFPFHNIVDEYETLREFLDCMANKWASNVAVEYKVSGGTVCKKYYELKADSDSIGQFLYDTYPKGTSIALLGKTSYEWLCAFFGIVNSGNIAVPIDKELGTEDIDLLLQKADAKCIFLDETLSQKVKVDTRQMKRIFMGNAEGQQCVNDILSLTFETGWHGSPMPEDIALIVFTSGTTGNYKGCALSHRNMAWNAMQGHSVLKLNSKDIALSVLPVNHMLEITAGILAPLGFGMRIFINDSLKYINRNMRTYHPTCMLVVPLLLETLHKTIWGEIAKKNNPDRVKKLMKVIAHTPLSFRRKCFREVIDGLGGRMRAFVVGGAPLDQKIIDDFRTWGILVVQGYGITECGPVIACNTDIYQRKNSVGRIAAGCKVKIVDGEICVRGPIVMQGYFGEPELTKEVFADGWFRTGDLGRMDRFGFLYLTGRKKNLIILSNGENVSPEELEQKLMQIEQIREVVVGEENGHLKAECYLGEEPDAVWAEVNQQIENMNRSLPTYKRIGSVSVRHEPFPKTTTQKIKRYEV